MARLPYDGFRADLWSLAVALFAMVSGFFPVEEATQRDWRFTRLATLQLRGTGEESSTLAIYSFYSRACPLSRPLVQLIDRMLQIHPPRRLPLPEVLAAPWTLDAAAGDSGEGGGSAQESTGAGASVAEAAEAEAVAEWAVQQGARAAEIEVDDAAIDGAFYRALGAEQPVGAEGVAPPRLRRQRACSEHVGA